MRPVGTGPVRRWVAVAALALGVCTLTVGAPLLRAQPAPAGDSAAGAKRARTGERKTLSPPLSRKREREKERKGAAAVAVPAVDLAAPGGAVDLAAPGGGAAGAAVPGEPASAAGAAAPVAAAQPKAEVPKDAPTVVALVDRKEASVGDRIVLTITTVAPTGVPTNLPTELGLGAFEVLSGDPVIEEKDLGDGHHSRSFRLEIAAYETGALEVPAIPVTYIGKDGRVLARPTEPVPVKITSLISNEPDPQLKEASEPVAVLEQDLTLVYVGAGIGIAALGAFLALELRRRWRLRDARRPAPPPRPAHEVALEKLGQLATSGMTSDSDLRLFYFQLSEIVREYLGGRFDFAALEMTTEELVAELAHRAPRGLVPGETAGWLSGCDLVKFAKLAPPPSEARGALETAIRMVESTRPRPEPQLSAAGARDEARPGGAAQGDEHGA